MSEILFLAHRLPFPPDRGDKIRSHHVLKALAKLAPVHVASFVDIKADWAHEDELAQVAASHCLAARSKPLALAGIEAALLRQPVSLAAFASTKLAHYVEQTLTARPISAIYVFSGQMGQYVPAGFAGRLIVDLVDVDSAKFEAYAAEGRWPKGWINAREGRLLAAEEGRLAARADTTLLVSEAEANLLRSRLVAPANVLALGNGIDTEGFDPARVKPALLGEGPHLVFTGQMDYAPNVAAALHGIEFVLPAVRRHHPQAQFHIVGRAPARELLARDGRDGVRIHGEVPDVRPFLAAADAVVAPLAIARGIQNKVLEAMAMARPVVLTSGAATGIGAEDGVQFAIGDGYADFSARVLALLANPGAAQAMGKAARQFVKRQRGWDAMLGALPAIMGFPKRRRRDAA
ncbi:MAG: TIGR03087 family PEP-CTERM/XrtA system glycosyltransferase [Candidatus Andeanibacterium colombiense]|uniref:TIGR03087 family PEP-CTERM/XrtA system glycosyltransferase n=1 Tax=Candidatus Andeanibacterium colombiense TaxID=3121345 RepID=A0AAJ6BNA5_9SPHN|nr:MAG: TIGR03087 family PEP-CTERM/XrtA system glycosyltransferase [Sphingomonadaceae bacterium]